MGVDNIEWMVKNEHAVSMAGWRRILADAIANGDGDKEDYARWMLRVMFNVELDNVEGGKLWKSQ